MKTEVGPERRTMTSQPRAIIGFVREVKSSLQLHMMPGSSTTDSALLQSF